VLHSISLAAVLAAALASIAGAVAAEGIYTCVDGRGRRITADRPIIDCIDREQTELSTGGLPRRKIGPSLTAAERAAEEEKQRRAAEESSKALEEKKRERALVTRYPNRAVHDKERAEALTLVDSVSAAARKRTGELQTQRGFLDRELEFYKLDPARTPPKIKRQVDEVDAQLAAQKRFLAGQDVEKVRVNTRFDEELARLKVLWAAEGGVPVNVAKTASASGQPAPANKALR
jgi:Domain of unknown function (DUF4124)